MRRFTRSALTLALGGVGGLLGACVASGQQSPQAAPPSAESATAQAGSGAVPDSEAWRQTQQKLRAWLSVQTIYSAEQVAALEAEFSARVSRMSPAELEELRKELDERLTVLLSPEAEEARTWLAGIMAVARNPEAQIGGPVPDVAQMTAAEIRAELDRFQRRRSAQRQSQASFDRARQRQVDASLERSARRTATRAGASPRTAAAFNETPYPNPYIPQRPPRQIDTGPPVYRVGAWGEPIRWNPLHDWRPWDAW